MLPSIFNPVFTRVIAMLTICVAAFGFTTMFGLDSYEFYLNNKLILKQSVNQPLNLRVLELSKAGENDQLGIRYIHCTIKGAGSERTIVLKDENGKTLRKWSFADATGTDMNMIIAVKELLALEKTYARSELSLHYAARELPDYEMLSTLRFK